MPKKMMCADCDCIIDKDWSYCPTCGLALWTNHKEFIVEEGS